MASRRNVLKLIGGGVVVAAAASGGFVALNGPSQAARSPWREAGRGQDHRRRALSYALLAPNPHNRQPWLVRLDGEAALTLFCDLDRRLPVTDPMDRQITIGCGAFLELLAMAAAQEGHLAEITPFPEGESMASLDRRAIAQVVFKAKAAGPDPLFAHALERRTNRNVYEAREVPGPLLEQVAASGRAFGVASSAVGDTDLAAWLRDLTWRAHRVEVETPRALQESVDLMRFGADEVAANPDGIAFEGPFFAAARMFGALNAKTIADPTSDAFKQGLEMYHKRAMSARAFGWLINDNATRVDQLNAGRAYVRMNLKATELGLSVHPWSQALQEYPEIAQLYADVHGKIGAARCVQMLYRIGYADTAIPAPRRSLETLIV